VRPTFWASSSFFIFFYRVIPWSDSNEWATKNLNGHSASSVALKMIKEIKWNRNSERCEESGWWMMLENTKIPQFPIIATPEFAHISKFRTSPSENPEYLCLRMVDISVFECTHESLRFVRFTPVRSGGGGAERLGKFEVSRIWFLPPPDDESFVWGFCFLGRLTTPSAAKEEGSRK